MSTAWKDCRRIIAKKIVLDQKQHFQNTRWGQLSNYYSTLVATFRSSTTVTLLPSRFDFMNLPDVIPLWKPEDSDTSTQAFDKAQPIFERAFKKYHEDARLLAIRSILAANRGVNISKLSTDPADYPETIYDSTFFGLATSQFSYWTYTSRELRPFPEVLQGERALSLRHLDRCTDSRQIGLIRYMLKVAGLDPTVTSWRKLVQLGECFVWINAPIRKRRNRKEVYSCLGLVCSPLSSLFASLWADCIVEPSFSLKRSAGEDLRKPNSKPDK